MLVQTDGKLISANKTSTLLAVNNSTRTHATDVRTGRTFLIDNGAKIFIFPVIHGSYQTSTITLTAANGTHIKTYGPKTLHLDFGPSRIFTWTFEMADVNRAIIGADFLHYFGLLVDIRHNRLVSPVDNSKSGQLPPRTRTLRYSLSNVPTTGIESSVNFRTSHANCSCRRNTRWCYVEISTDNLINW